MEPRYGILAYKLCELEKEYGRLQSRIQLCQKKDPDKIHDELIQLRDECKALDLLLEQSARSSRLPSAAALARAQLEYEQQVDRLLHTTLPQDMHGHNATPAEDDIEAFTLYAEYAIDFATQTMRHALAAALQSLELQMRAEENAKPARSDSNHE